ncbi:MULTISPECIES: hypothetical protein [Paraburkholderia]|uniref:hypothetical protein n=1 Tax=Paraburkholderia TaxID=1822464 RepID=UPI00224F9AAD|nr:MULTISPECIES: hypothetical protein [Paraburkholderia]MCX4165705.1 hypothetical protein [Paraburkholderia megapolitana]MDN7161196.1 hypothetical protein [Paraburkholderia sp. CHISQ3]MDQ6498243.1 hypothetical protein [Paraburkholderia megapolitana]
MQQTLMLKRRRLIVGGIALVSTAHFRFVAAQTAEQSAFRFNGTDYFFRWSDDTLFEFTPPGQTNLDTWSDMVSVVIYRGVKTADDLASAANSLLDSTKLKGAVLKTRSVPRTPDRPAEHFIASMMAAPGVVEGVFTRFVLMDGVGYALIFSHRFYGQDLHKAAQLLGDWENAHGADMEKALMSFEPVPGVSALEKWKRAGVVKG